MKKALIGLVLLIIIGAGAYIFMKPGNAVAPQNAQTALDANHQTLGTLVAAGSPVTCTFSTTTVDSTTHGTVYVANGMVAGDFTTEVKGISPIESHMIVRDGTSYVWTSLSSQGFKSTVTPGATSGSDKGVDYNAQMPYSCKPWATEDAKFGLPNNIAFSATPSYTAPPQGAGATGAAPEGSVKGTAAMCAKCSSLPGAQKAQCLSALQCQ